MSEMADSMPAPRVQVEDAAERLGSLFDEHQRFLHRLALRMGAEAADAADVVQEAFLRAARHTGGLPDTDEGARAWLVRVVVNLCRDAGRRSRTRERAHAILAKQPPAEPTPDGGVLAREAVRSALRALPPRQRALVVLCELEGLERKEAARLLGIAPVTARWHLAAGRRALAERLAAWREPETRGES